MNLLQFFELDVFHANNCTQYPMDEKYRKSGCFARGSRRCREGTPLRGKMGRGSQSTSQGTKKDFTPVVSNCFGLSQNVSLVINNSTSLAAMEVREQHYATTPCTVQ